MAGISCFPKRQAGRSTNYWYTSFFIIIIVIIVLYLTWVKIQINDKTNYKSHTECMLLSCQGTPYSKQARYLKFN